MKSHEWIELSAGEAENHELYGLGGCLSLLLVLLAVLGLGCVFTLFELRDHVINFQISKPGWKNVLVASSLVGLAFSTTLISMMVLKSRFFRIGSLFFLFWTFPTGFVYATLAGWQFDSVMFASSFTFWILVCCAWSVYVNLSVRVRVTFDRQIRRVQSNSVS